jgi:hypothetical protein
MSAALDQEMGASVRILLLHPGRGLVRYGVTKKCFRTASATAAAAARGKRRPAATGTNASRHAPRSQRKRPRTKACAALPVVTAPHSMSTRAVSAIGVGAECSGLALALAWGLGILCVLLRGEALAIFMEANCVSREREGEEEKASLFEASCVSRAREGENASLFEANCVSREREGEEEKASLPCGVVLLRAEALTIFIGRLEANCVCDEREKALLS